MSFVKYNNTEARIEPVAGVDRTLANAKDETALDNLVQGEVAEVPEKVVKDD